MIETLVSTAFWPLYAIGGGLIAVSLYRTFLSSVQLDGARHRIDDGSERPAALEAYRLARASARLTALSGLIVGLLVALAVLGALLGPIGKSTAVIATAALALAADEIRLRHLRLERRFDALWLAHEEATGGRTDLGLSITA